MGTETRINADCQDGAWVVRVGGPLDAHGVLQLCASLSRLTHLGTHDLVVDLQPVSDVDPEALPALASAARLAQRSGLGFAVLAPGGPARRALEQARLEDVLAVEDGEKAARGRAAASSRRRRGRRSLTHRQALEEAA